MNTFIRQLTGVRFVAAFWVLMYHYQPALATLGVLVPVVHEFIRVGSLGVDLFFTLSGFILSYTYLHKLGPAFKARAAGHFLWLRLARIYPVHFVMLNIAGLAVVAQGIVGSEDAAARSWLNPWSYIKQLLLIQEWGPNPSRGWNFVAWSLSMEWLAYLLMPFVGLVLWRLRDRAPTWLLAVFAFLCLSPLIWIGITRDNDPFLTMNWASSIRVLSEFIAGGFVYLVVRRLNGEHGPSKMVRTAAFWLACLIPIGIVGLSFALGSIGSLQWPGLENEAPRAYIVIVPFLVAWIGALALTDRGPSAFLSHRRLVLGGFISYSLYMVHIVWWGLWRAGMRAIGIDGGPLYLIGVVGLFVMAIVFAYLMWRLVEEPAREWLRSKIGAPTKPIEEATEEAEEAGQTSPGSPGSASAG